MKLTTNGEAQQNKEITTDIQYTLVTDLPNKPPVKMVSQIREQTRIRSDTEDQLTNSWKDEFQISAQYQA